MLNIIYTGNDKMFKGLYLSILSILRRTNESINFYLLTAKLTEINKEYIPLSKKHQEILVNLIKHFNNKNTFKCYDCSDLYKKYFANYDVPRITPYSAFKLFIPEFVYENNIVLYLDTDTLINGDIKEVFNIDMANYEICVCHLANIDKIFDNNATFFNVGTTLINIPVVKKTNCFKKAIDYYVKVKPRYNEESAMNITCNKVQHWENEYRFNYQWFDIKDDTIIRHFSGATDDICPCPIKPWNIDAVQHWLKLHNWDEDYQYYKEQMKLNGEEI